MRHTDRSGPLSHFIRIACGRPLSSAKFPNESFFFLTGPWSVREISLIFHPFSKRVTWFFQANIPEKARKSAPDTSNVHRQRAGFTSHNKRL
jgi:hypothetical protein